MHFIPQETQMRNDEWLFHCLSEAGFTFKIFHRTSFLNTIQYLLRLIKRKFTVHYMLSFTYLYASHIHYICVILALMSASRPHWFLYYYLHPPLKNILKSELMI